MLITHIYVNSFNFVRISLWLSFRNESVKLLVLFVPFDSIQGSISQIVMALQGGSFSWDSVLWNVDSYPFQPRYG